MTSESIPVGLQTLLAKHYFLAQIQRGYKPCITNMTLIDASSWSGAIYRAWFGESRKTAISDIEKIISETIDSISIHIHNNAFLRLIINALASTRVGLETMTTTYRSDPDMIGRLKVQLTNIDLQLEEYRPLIKGYKSKEDATIIEKVVQSAETADKESFRNFLTGNTDTLKPVSDISAERVRRRRQRVRPMDTSE